MAILGFLLAAVALAAMALQSRRARVRWRNGIDPLRDKRPYRSGQRGSPWLETLIVALALAVFFPTGPLADSWPHPRTQTYEAADGTARFTVVPGEIAYQAGHLVNVAKPQATLEINNGGDWIVAWRRELTNRIAPTEVLIAPGARQVVTIDEWGAVGTSENVVSIYGAAGELIRTLSLRDLLPGDYILALPRTVSSIAWGGDHQIDHEHLTLRIRIPSDAPLRDPATFLDLPVRLSDGGVVTPSSEAWREALQAVARTSPRVETGSTPPP